MVARRRGGAFPVSEIFILFPVYNRKEVGFLLVFYFFFFLVLLFSWLYSV